MVKSSCFAQSLLLLAIASRCATAESLVRFRTDGTEHIVSGHVVVEAQDGGLLLLGQDGVMWAVQPDELIARESDDAPFELLAADDLAREVLEKLPAGFRVHQTAHYVICYNTTKAYAQWCGALYERLYRAFYNYWGRLGMELTEAPPLVALVFQDKGSYADYGRDELGGAIDSIIGYYSLRTNRIATYDLTGIDDLRGSGDRITSATHVNQILVRPQAERTVATVIHEATHQLAFNSGLQTRFADIPLWLSEGLAIYFETPDLTSKSGWRTIGGVNHVRLRQFHGYLRSRPENSLATLLGTDARFRDTRAAADAYAEAWALCYYLIRYHRKEFVKYLQLLAEKQPMNNATPHDRLRDFESVFGMNLQELNTRFLRQFSKVH